MRKKENRTLMEKIKVLFRQMKLTDGEVAQALDVHLMTVGRWRRGEAMPRRNQVRKLEDFARKVTRGGKAAQKYSGSWGDKSSGAVTDSETVRIPILSNVPVHNLDDTIEEKIGVIHISPWALGGNYKDCYALKVDETSTAGVGREDIVVVRSSRKAKVGDLVVAKVNDRFRIKELEKNGNAELAGTVIYLMKKCIK